MRTLGDYLMITFIAIICFWAGAGFSFEPQSPSEEQYIFVEHDKDCLCPLCELKYDYEWQLDHAEGVQE